MFGKLNRKISQTATSAKFGQVANLPCHVADVRFHIRKNVSLAITLNKMGNARDKVLCARGPTLCVLEFRGSGNECIDHFVEICLRPTTQLVSQQRIDFGELI